jgi:hypothetical protein
LNSKGSSYFSRSQTFQSSPQELKMAAIYPLHLSQG